MSLNTHRLKPSQPDGNLILLTAPGAAFEDGQIYFHDPTTDRFIECTDTLPPYVAHESIKAASVDAINPWVSEMSEAALKCMRPKVREVITDGLLHVSLLLDTTRGAVSECMMALDLCDLVHARNGKVTAYIGDRAEGAAAAVLLKTDTAYALAYSRMSWHARLPEPSVRELDPGPYAEPTESLIDINEEKEKLRALFLARVRQDVRDTVDQILCRRLLGRVVDDDVTFNAADLVTLGVLDCTFPTRQELANVFANNTGIDCLRSHQKRKPRTHPISRFFKADSHEARMASAS